MGDYCYLSAIYPLGVTWKKNMIIVCCQQRMLLLSHRESRFTCHSAMRAIPVLHPRPRLFPHLPCHSNAAARRRRYRGCGQLVSAVQAEGSFAFNRIAAWLLASRSSLAFTVDRSVRSFTEERSPGVHRWLPDGGNWAVERALRLRLSAWRFGLCLLCVSRSTNPFSIPPSVAQERPAACV